MQIPVLQECVVKNNLAGHFYRCIWQEVCRIHQYSERDQGVAILVFLQL